VRGRERRNRRDCPFERNPLVVGQGCDEAFDSLPPDLQNLSDHGTPAVGQIDSLDSAIDFVLAARKQAGPVERVDGAPGRCYRQRYARGEFVDCESFAGSLQLKQYPSLRERQVEVGGNSHHLRLATFNQRQEGGHKAGAKAFRFRKINLHGRNYIRLGELRIVTIFWQAQHCAVPRRHSASHKLPVTVAGLRFEITQTEGFVEAGPDEQVGALQRGGDAVAFQGAAPIEPTLE
jgi:hypothetical protein